MLKYFLSSLLLFLSLMSYSQVTYFYDSDGNEVSNHTLASEFKVIYPDSLVEDRAIVRRYTIDGTMLSEVEYFPYSKKVNDGRASYWTDKGQLEKIIDYKNNRMHGELKCYHPNGQIRRHDFFQNQEFVEGTCWDSTGTEVQHYDYLVMPQFPGGEEALFEFIGKTIIYPEEARQNGVHGIVYTHFVVDETGQLIEHRILKGVSELLDQEALRVIGLMPDWEPGLCEGEPVRFSYNLPIRYSLREDKRTRKRK